MKKLIPLIDFVISKAAAIEVNGVNFLACRKYALFLNKPLKLEMFFPCDDEGNRLNDRCNYLVTKEGSKIYEEQKKYEKAKEKVLFVGLSLEDAKYHVDKNRRVELLTGQNFNKITLTETALKQMNL